MGLKGSTCFILGAGASKPFGFPLGAELRSSIIRHLSDAENEEFYYQIVAECGFDDSLIRDFRNKLLFSDYPSVDYFIEQFPEYLAIGKICMAASLLLCEHQESVFATSDWYKSLLDIVEASAHGGKLMQLSIVTFNYDRSLEYYVIRAMSTRWRVSLVDAASRLSELGIVHVYGWLGDPFNASDPLHIAYGESLSVPVVRRAADAITIMPEARDDNEHFVKIQNILKRSQQLVFLGFGFHIANLRRLGFGDSGQEWAVDKALFASTSGMPFRITNALRESWLQGFQRVVLTSTTAKGCFSMWAL